MNISKHQLVVYFTKPTSAHRELSTVWIAWITTLTVRRKTAVHVYPKRT
jgi:hypothetical protein